MQALVGLAPSNHGTTVDGLFTLASFFPGATGFFGLCPACEEQAAGSAFLGSLNAGGDTVPGPSYTVIQSANDEVVTPYTSAFLAEPRVTNIRLRDQCALDQGEHLSMPYDHIADGDVLNALDPAHPAPPPCTPVLPIVGGSTTRSNRIASRSPRGVPNRLTEQRWGTFGRTGVHMRGAPPNILYLHSHDTGRYVQPYGHPVPTPEHPAPR